jgi:glycerol-3-phosphate acyltransferase PlsY
MSTLALPLFLAAAFLAGSVPFGLLFVMLAGKGDVRSVGSGNIGATNVARVGGKWLGILTLALDISKGFLPVFIALRFGLEPSEASLMALAAVAGHVFTPWLGFMGGKGVATALGASLGASLAFGPWLALPSLAVFLLAVAITRYVSFGSILGALAMPISLGIVLYQSHAPGTPLTPPLLAFTAWMAIALLLIVKHHANISRLIKGTENPLWGKKMGDGTNG